MKSLLTILLLSALSGCHAQEASPLTIDFEAGLPADTQVEGDARPVDDPAHGGAKSLRVEPNAVAVIPVSEKPAWGAVTVWAYDAGTQLEDEKQYAFGPLVGLRDLDGGDVVYGRVYARYLAGNTGYGYINAVTGDWFSRQWAGGQVQEGWRKWTFTVLRDGGMEVTVDDRKVHAENAEMPSGFQAVVVYGSKENFADAAIVDDITVDVQGEITPGVIERTPLEGDFDIPFREDMAGRHPRLFMTDDELPGLRERCAGTHKRFFDATVEYGLASLGIPEDEPWLNDDTDAQRWGWWKMPTVAFLSRLSEDARYRQTTKDLLLAICRSRHFQTSGEVDCGMGAANVLAGAAIGYDFAYDDLTDEERRFVQDKLWLQVQRLHEKGFLEKGPGAHYWQQDPQNNHLWHRMAGLMLACLALYGDVPEIDGYLDYAIERAREIVRWLPEDGSSHEAVGYQAFGTQYLIPVLWALQRCTTVDLLTDQPGIRELPHFRAHMVLPDRQQVWDYADGGRGVSWFSNYHYFCAGLFGDRFAQALHMANYEAAPNSYDYQCWNLLYWDADLEPADLAEYPTWRYFPDLEIATFRESWSDPDALACFFKCGPYGGHLLNEYRESFEEPHYVNVAHDHPDANSFMVAWKGQFFAMDAGYTHTKNATADHNTILVNGKGQAGEERGGAWLQPIADMGSRARITEFFGAPGWGVVQGEAGGFYEDLEEFTRTLVYVDDPYVILHDHIVANQPSTIDWLYHCDGDWEQVGSQTWHITKGDATFRVKLLYPQGLACELADHTADGGEGETKKRLKATLEGVTDAHILATLGPADDPINWMPNIGPAGDAFLVWLQPKSRDTGRDVVLIADEPSERQVEDFATDARVLIHSIADDVETATIVMVGGTHFDRGRTSFLSSDRPVNALTRPDGDILRAWASAPLGGEPGPATLSLPAPLLSGVTGAALNGVNVDRADVDGRATFACDLPTWRDLLP